MLLIKNLFISNIHCSTSRGKDDEIWRRLFCDKLHQFFRARNSPLLNLNQPVSMTVSGTINSNCKISFQRKLQYFKIKWVLLSYQWYSCYVYIFSLNRSSKFSSLGNVFQRTKLVDFQCKFITPHSPI